MANLIEILLKSNSGQVVTELGKVDKSLGKTGKTAKEAGGMFDGLGSSIVGLAAGYLTLGAAVKAIDYVIDAAAEAEVVQAQLNAVLESTAGAAGMSADELNDLATNLSKLSGVDDELIVRQEAVMLTFTNVSKDVFPQAMEAALNLSAALGQDLQSSIIQIGKALNDPISGVTALQRVGVRLTDQQKEQVKVLVEQNKMYEAQALILGELETEFGGAAEAMGDTYTGSVNKLKTSIGNLAETIGSVFLPELQKGIDKVAEWVNSLVYAIDVELKINQAVEDGKITRQEANRIINEYTWTTMSAADAEQWLAQKTGETSDAVAESDRTLDDRVQSIEANAKAMAGLGDEERWLKQREQELKETMDELSTVMAGRLGDEMDNYAEKLIKVDENLADLKEQAEETWEKVAELKKEQGEADTPEERERITEQIQEQVKKYGELHDKYVEEEASIKRIAEEHAIATRKIIFDILQQQLAMDGLTQAEADSLVAVAGKWGLIDKETQDAWNAIADYIKGLEGASVTAEGVEDAMNSINGGEPMMELNTQTGDVNTTLSETETASARVGDAFVTSGDKSEGAIDGVITKVEELQDKLNKMSSKTYSLEFQTSTPTQWVYDANPTYDLLGAQGVENFVVPPGYSEPYNPFTVGLSSGEGLNITPAGGGAGGGIIVNVYADQISNDIDVERMAYRVAEIIYDKQHGG
ncbi:MAG: phage tail length tape measure family protein [Candidatus Paceibacterota bacterium]|jgi:hypothetical protein